MPDRHLNLIIVVSGAPRPVRVNLNEKLEHAASEALRESGNAGQPADNFELRTDDGTLLDQSQRAGQVGLRDGQTLFLNPRAGAGG